MIHDEDTANACNFTKKITTSPALAITVAYPNFRKSKVKSMCVIRTVHPLLGSPGIFDQRYGNNLHYEYRFVRHPYDFMRVCTQEIVDIIVIYCLAAFSRRCVTMASAARACPCDRYKPREHNEKIFSRPLPRHVVPAQTATGVTQQVIKPSHYDPLVIGDKFFILYVAEIFTIHLLGSD